jgi:hypothetical protein
MLVDSDAKIKQERRKHQAHHNLRMSRKSPPDVFRYVITIGEGKTGGDTFRPSIPET